jgi:hypothetical protein
MLLDGCNFLICVHLRQICGRIGFLGRQKWPQMDRMNADERLSPGLELRENRANLKEPGL